jgi:type I restriction enzyme M protein
MYNPRQLILNEWLELETISAPPKSIICYISGKVKKATPEEYVRQDIAKRLIEELGYDKRDMEVDFPITIGAREGKVDIAVFLEGEKHLPDRVHIVVEAAPPGTKPSDPQHGVDQLKSYMAALPNCRYGLWSNGEEELCFEKILMQGRFEFKSIAEIPPRGIDLKDYEKLDYSLLRPATNLKPIFKRCHNYIHANQGFPKDKAFEEFLKIIFTKVHDERWSKRIQFYVTDEEMNTEEGRRRLYERISKIFENVKKHYPHIFERDEKIELNPTVLAYIVSQLQHYFLSLTDADVKGEAYEEIVGPNLRGDRGEFFTPRNVCKAAVEVVFFTFPREEWSSLKVIDPACGTGGFLIAVINFLRNHLLEKELKRSSSELEAVRTAEEKLKDYCEKFLYAIDINPLLAKATQMNEVMHGNGSGNVYALNALTPPSAWPPEARALRENFGRFDIVFTNPPFGSKLPIDDPEILRQYDLGYEWKKFMENKFERTNKLRARVPPEQLFIERCIQLLRPGGRMAIVVPDAILNSPGLDFIRYWILTHSKIIAVFDLPQETFLPSVGTKTSLLVLEKRHEPIDLDLLSKIDEEFFAPVIKRVGHDRRGAPVYAKTSNGKVLYRLTERKVIKLDQGIRKYVEEKVPEPVLDDELPLYVDLFKRWYYERQQIAGR